MQTELTAAPPAAGTTSGEPGRTHVWSIVGLATVLRLGVFWLVVAEFPHNWLFRRGIELGIIADNLQAGRGFSSPYGGSTGPTALLAPGYPAIVAAIFRLFGSFTFGSEIAILLMQIAFSSLTVLMLMHIAQRMFGARTANVAGVIWAVSLPLLWMPTIFWESCLSTLLLVSFLALAWRCAERPSLRSWVVMGGVCGVSTLINPALLLVFLAVMGWVLYRTRKTMRSSNGPLLSVLIVLLVLTPWVARNREQMHAFIPVRSCFGFELWNGNQPHGGGLLQESLHPSFNPSELALYSSMGEVSYMQQKMALAEGFIRAHPTDFLGLTIKRLALFWTGSAQKAGDNVSWMIVFHATVITMVGLAGLVLLLRRKRGLALLYALPLLLFPIPYYITHADLRYRLVLDPLLTILAAFAITCGYALLSTAEKPEAAEDASVEILG